MNFSVTVFVILISTCIVNASVLDPVIENVVHLSAAKPPSEVPGIWRKKTIWKPRWVKEWKSAKVMKPVWRKIWSPVQIREWVPIPKPPPGWDASSTPLVAVKTTLKNNIPPWQPKNSTPLWQSTENAPVWQSTENTPLWDPIPYPESQQPPPPSPQPSYPPDDSCDNGGGCGDSTTFNSQQISGIIGANSAVSDHNPEYSETVNHLTRVPPNGNWRQPQQPLNAPLSNGHPQLPHYLVPPRFTSLPSNDVNPRFRNPNQPPNHHHHHHHPRPVVTNRPVTNVQVKPSLGLKINQNQNKDVQPWNPLPPQNNNVRGHFITKAPDQPYKFQLPDTVSGPKNNIPGNQGEPPQVGVKPVPNINNSLHPQVNNDFIQQADLVSEYHYSEFDLPGKGLFESGKPEFEVELNENKNFKHQQHNSQFTQAHQQHTSQPSQQRSQIRQEQQQPNLQLHQGQQQQRPLLQQQNLQLPSGKQQQNPQFSQEQQQHPKLHFPQNQQQQRSQPAQVQQQQIVQLGQEPEQQKTEFSQVQQQQRSQFLQTPQDQRQTLPQGQQHSPQPSEAQRQQELNLFQKQQQHQHQQQYKKEPPKVQNQNTPKRESDVSNENRLVVESKPRQVRTESRPQVITTNKLQLNTNLEQLQAIAKEIFPIFRTTTSVPPPSFPTNHRFAPNLPQRDNNLSEEADSQSLSLRPQQPPLTPRPITLDLVNNLNYNFTADTSPRTAETTTPFTVYPSSSFTTTAEPQTNSPVFVVTPVYTSKS